MICYQIGSLPVMDHKDKMSDDDKIVSFPLSSTPDHNATLVETLSNSEPSTVNSNQSTVTSQGMGYITNTECNSLLYIAAGSSSPDKKYVAQVVYEVKRHNREWLIRFMAAKCLNALLKVMPILNPPIIDVSNSTLKIHFHQMLRQMLIFPSHLKILMVTLN